MRQTQIVIGFKKNIDKILFLIASGYLIFVVAWFFRTNKINSDLSENETPEKTVIVAQKLSPEKNELSLEETAQNLPNAPKSKLLSSSIINKKIPNISPPQPTEIPPLPEPQILPPPAILPPISSLSSPTTSPKPARVPIPPPPKPKTIARKTSVPVLNSQKENSSSNSESPLISSLPTETLDYDYTLVGLLEMENQTNMALFKINNVFQKVSVGEEIGVSGWILTAIYNKQAIVNQQGKIVRLAVGEKM